MDWVSALAVFVTHLHQTNNNEEVTKNIKIRWDINPEWVISLFIQSHRTIHYQKIDDKDIADPTKLVKELVRYSLVQSINGHFCQDYIQIERGELIDRPTNKKKS